MVDTKRKITAAHPRSEPSKRQRVSRACDQCRLAREKCDGIQPTCFTCASTNRVCSYTANPRKRGIQPGYIRTLELTLAWSFAHVPGAEDSVKQALHDGKTQAILSGKDADNSNKLHRKWRRSVFCRGIDRLLSGSLDSDDLDELDTASEEEEEDKPAIRTATTEASLITLVSQTNPTSTEPRVHFNEPISTNDRGHTCLSGAASRCHTTRLKLPSDLWQFLDIYFNYTHNWLPIVEKHDVLKVAYSYSQDGLDLPMNGPGSGEHALLWSIFALASIQQASTTASIQTLASKPAYTPAELVRISRALIQQPNCDLELGHAQAQILHALIAMGAGDFDLAWIMLGRAIRLTLLLDNVLLCGPPTTKHTTDPSPSRIQHTLLASFVLETLLSARLRKLPMLNYTHLSLLGLLPEDSLEEWHPWEGCSGFGSQPSPPTLGRMPSHSLSVFNQLCRLMGLVSEHVAGKLESDNILPQLSQWLALLPPHSLLNHDSSPQSTPQRITLHVACQGIAASFGMPEEQQAAVEAAGGLLARFSQLHGLAALPSFFRVLLDSGFMAIANVPLESRQTIREAMETVRTVWKAGDDVLEIANGHAPSNIASPTTRPEPSPPEPSHHEELQPFAMNHPTSSPGWIGIPFASPQSTSQAHQFSAKSLADTSALSAPTPNAIPQNLQIDYDASPLQRYTSVGSLDLDALFDDLDGLEHADTRPQFMQNLGFAPGADLTDILASDYGQFDPLLTAYMSGNVNVLRLETGDGGTVFNTG